MTPKTSKTLEDIPAIRWLALVLLAFAMFFAYFFEEILSPLKSILETSRGWDSLTFGTYAGSYPFFNVFFFFLIIAGVILDKMGVRFTAILAGALMVIGAAVNWYAVTDMFIGTALANWLSGNLYYVPVFDQLGVSPFYEGMPASAKLASVGYMVFGCGIEMAEVSVTCGIIKWFKGKELALALGLNMAIGRLGVATCMMFSPLIARSVFMGKADVSHAVLFGMVFLTIGLFMFVSYFAPFRRAAAAQKFY